MSATDSVLQALTLDPDLPQVRLSLATIYQGTGRIELSEDQLRLIIEEQPASSDAHRILGQTLLAQRELDEAAEEYQRAIELRPNYWRNHGELGLLYLQIGRRPLAAAAFRRVTELLPESARGFQMLGAVYQALGELQVARENYERALQLGELPSTYSNIGLLHYVEGNFAEAAKAFERARDLSPSDFRVRRNLGDVYQQLGQTEQAQAEYQRAVELTMDLVKVNPTDATQLGQLAVLEALVGRHRDAKRHADEAVTIAPDDGNLLYFKAVVHARAGEQEAALSSLRDALRHRFPAALIRQQGELTSLEDLPEFNAILEEGLSQRLAEEDPDAQFQQLRGLLEALDSVVQREGRQ